MSMTSLSRTELHNQLRDYLGHVTVVHTLGDDNWADLYGWLGSYLMHKDLRNTSVLMVPSVELRRVLLNLTGATLILSGATQPHSALTVTGVASYLPMVLDAEAMRSRSTESLEEQGRIDVWRELVNSIDSLIALPGPLTVADPPGSSTPSYAQAAAELRDMTGLSAAELAECMGVTRESYQRWIAGGQIKDANAQQLQYLHVLVYEVSRRLGPSAVSAWLQRPLGLGGATPVVTPLALLKAGRFDEVHRLVVELPDAYPIQDGRFVALTRMSDESGD